MKGLLADPKAIRERCEITAPPTVEELQEAGHPTIEADEDGEGDEEYAAVGLFEE